MEESRGKTKLVFCNLDGVKEVPLTDKSMLEDSSLFLLGVDFGETIGELDTLMDLLFVSIFGELIDNFKKSELTSCSSKCSDLRKEGEAGGNELLFLLFPLIIKEELDIDLMRGSAIPIVLLSRESGINKSRATNSGSLYCLYLFVSLWFLSLYKSRLCLLSLDFDDLLFLLFLPESSESLEIMDLLPVDEALEDAAELARDEAVEEALDLSL